MVTVTKIDAVGDFADLKAEWNRLLAETDRPGIFLTHEWLFSWWKIYGADHELFILLVKEEHTILGIAPLMITASRGISGTRRKIEFIGTPNADYCDFIGKDKNLIGRQMMVYLKHAKVSWDKIELSQISDRSALGHVLENLSLELRLISRNIEIETCHGYQFEGKPEERGQFAFRRGATLKKAYNFFKRNGGLVLERIADPGEMEKFLPQFFHLHINRWKNTLYPSKFLKEENRQFFYELVRTLGPSGKICFFVLKSGDLPVASIFNFEFDKVINHYTIAINTLFTDRSPGILLLLEQSEALIRQGYELDLSRGAQQYKNLLANREYKNFQFTIYRKKSAYRIAQIYSGMKNIRPVRQLLANEKFQDMKARIISILKDVGIWRFIWLVIRKGLQFIIRRRDFLYFTHEGKPEFDFKPGVPVDCRKLEIHDLEKIATFYGAAAGSRKYLLIQERLNLGDDCFAALYNGYIVSTTWGLHHSDPYPAAGLVVTPKKNEVISSDALTSPVFRGMGIRPYLMTFALKEYYEKGVKIIGVVEKSNRAQLKSIEKLKYTCLGRVVKLKIFGIKIL